MDTQTKQSYENTLNLPRTDFPIRAQSAVYDPQVLARWAEQDLYRKTFEHNAGKSKFILHDGPPYANGDIHLGHAYNKILKDIYIKYERMNGKHAPCIPGWDCHGLPIELKVTTQHPTLGGAELKKACREYAQNWIEVQRESFKKLGVLMDFARPYATMDHGYEASIVRAFGQFVKKGYIQKKLKTVPWCASCQTVLAAAEIEYQERKDPSVYVLFPLQAQDVAKLVPSLLDKKVGLLVWTTTPWTLPLNRAVVIHPKAKYAVVQSEDQYFIVAADLVEKLSVLMEKPMQKVAELSPDELVGLHVQHPFIDNIVPVIADGMVSLEDGTACVHSAPGCGPEDYELGVRNKLEIYSPLTADGKYSVDIKPQELVGMPVADGQFWVMKKCAEVGNLFFKQNIKHSYPHCWRCRNGLIFRATVQWFCDLSKNNLQEKAVAAIDSISMVPEKSNNRFKAAVGGRLEWCLSRQRAWGVPIPALMCVDSDYVYATPEFIEKVAQGIEQNGIEYWDTVDISQIAPADLKCPKTGSTNFIKEKDILDVWFESGVSHYAVLKDNPTQAIPANMYLEGKDQHRAWFQSALLTGLVLEDQAPMKEIVTHGFTVDDKGRKMSKSLGNVVSPQELIDQLGTDGLRLWVTSNDCDSDPVVSKVLLHNVSEVYRKIRNTCRFLISNLYDFDISKDAVAHDQLLEIDKYALYQLQVVNFKLHAAYQKRDLAAVYHELADYCVKELSALYLDIIKDRLYVEKADSLKRRSAQTVCWYILDTLNHLMAPILSITSELISDHYVRNKTQSVHLNNMTDLSKFDVLFKDAKYRSLDLPEYIIREDKLLTQEQFEVGVWGRLRDIRSHILRILEQKRNEEVIKHSRDAQVTLFVDTDFAGYEQVQAFKKLLEQSGQSFTDFLEEFCIVSQARYEQQGDAIVPGLYISVDKAEGQKCARCWQFKKLQSEDLCLRCFDIVK